MLAIQVVGIDLGFEHAALVLPRVTEVEFEKKVAARVMLADLRALVVLEVKILDAGPDCALTDPEGMQMAQLPTRKR